MSIVGVNHEAVRDFVVKCLQRAPFEGVEVPQSRCEDGYYHDIVGTGFVASIQWRDGSYSNVGRRTLRAGDEPTFELALLDAGGDFVKLTPYDDVLAYATLDEIIETILGVLNG